MDNYLIYKHTSPSGKSYIGQTKDYDRRCFEHQTSTGCRVFKSAIQKHGWDNFTHEILIEGLSLEEANHWEPFFISEHNTLAPNGYNLRTGGFNSSLSEETKAAMSAAKLGTTHTDETKAKMSAAKQNVSDETKAKISAARLGIPKSEETKAKMSAAQQNKSDETKAKISAAQMGKKRGPYKKKVK
jgi:group I intron endonuclease